MGNIQPFLRDAPSREVARWNSEKKKDVAARIQRHLKSKIILRKQLVCADLGLNTIHKALIGDFTESTLLKIERELGVTFDDPIADAPSELGGYSFEVAQRLEGTYLCLRPFFSKRDIIYAYLLEMKWLQEEHYLSFCEKAREQHSGGVFIPFAKTFLYLVTMAGGAVRTLTLNFPEDGIARGIITTLHHRTGAIRIPATGPILLKRLTDGEQPPLGRITSEHHSYEQYYALLSSVLTEEFAIVSNGPSPPAARQATTVVSEPHVNRGGLEPGKTVFTAAVAGPDCNIVSCVPSHL